MWSASQLKASFGDLVKCSSLFLWNRYIHFLTAYIIYMTFKKISNISCFTIHDVSAGLPKKPIWHTSVSAFEIQLCQQQMTYRPERITVKTVSMMITFNPDVTSGDFDIPVFVSHGSRNKQHNDWYKNKKRSNSYAYRFMKGKMLLYRGTRLL